MESENLMNELMEMLVWAYSQGRKDIKEEIEELNMNPKDLQENFQILENAKGYDECGSGGYHAISSLYSTEGLNITPQDRLRKAIECANEFVMSVDNKINMVELEYTKDKKK